MKVILLKDLYKHGVSGEVVKVAPGFARNYLIPRKIAVQATGSALKQTENIRANAAAHRAQYENMLNDLAHQIDGVELIFGRRAASTGKLFGSVTTQEIADELMVKTGVDINRRRISQKSLREVGVHEVPVRLGSENPPVLKITIVPEDELAEFLAARERGEQPEADAFVEDAGNAPTEVMPAAMVQEAIDQAANAGSEQADDE